MHTKCILDMKPVLLTMDDDPQVLIAIQRDLGRQYGKRFHIVGTDSGKKALQYKDQDVFIVGCANSAGQAAIHFSKYAKTVRANSLNEKSNKRNK